MMDLYAMNISNKSEVPICEPDKIDDAFIVERLKILLSNRFADACSPNLLNINLVGSKVAFF